MSQAASNPEPGNDRARQDAEGVLRMMAQAASLLPGAAAMVSDFLAIPAPATSPPNDASAPGRPQTWHAQQRYQALIEQIPVITFMAAIDETRHELYVSPQIEAVLGFTQEEWLDNPFLWYNQLHPDDREEWQRQFGLTCATGVDFKSDYRLLARDGHVVWIHGECRLIRDEAGTPLFLQGVAYDISESKRAEEAMRRIHHDLEIMVSQRTAELAAANDALRTEILEHQEARTSLASQAIELAEIGRKKDEFLAILSHELRNPLSSLAMAGELLRNPQLKPEDRQWAQSTIERQVYTMTRLIDDLLDVSRINRGTITLRKTTMDFVATIQHAMEATRSFFHTHRHQLMFSPPDESLWVNGDNTRLEQVMSNLLNNAAKYTPPGGRIVVDARADEKQVIVAVRDNGIGIPANMIGRVFDLFTQVDPSTSRTSQWGMGIGLALVHDLLELHGGTIAAASDGVGKGSEFILRLPRVAAPSQAPRAAATVGAASAGPLDSRKVLIVEDHPDSAAGISRLLKSWNHNVRVAHNGPAALAAALEFLPHFILLDIGLPGMDGYQVAQKIRQQSIFEKTYLLAITGYGRQEDRTRATAAGFNAHMTKPLNPEALRQLLAAEPVA